jgi:L-asparagine oxygenase
MSIMRELPIDFTFTKQEKADITRRFLGLTVNPYKCYPAFKQQIRSIISHLPALERFIAFMEEQYTGSLYEEPFVFIENTPIDPILPLFENVDPVQEKYRKKKTFVAEGFLQTYAELSAQHPIAYLNVNEGDVFQDIFPKESLKYSQSQKALGPIYFHKDFPNHFVRPDFVNILALRSHEQNEIYTTFCSNKDILENLSESVKEKLRHVEFYTPYDAITLNAQKVKLKKAPNHAILSGVKHLRIFENRTIGLNPEAQEALEALLQVAHQYKKSTWMQPGDFVSISNNLSLHGKEVHAIANEEERLKRWSLKTVNVQTCAPHMKHFIEGTDYLVNGY